LLLPADSTYPSFDSESGPLRRAVMPDAGGGTPAANGNAMSKANSHIEEGGWFRLTAEIYLPYETYAVVPVTSRIGGPLRLTLVAVAEGRKYAPVSQLLTLPLEDIWNVLVYSLATEPAEV
jgi:hypothetical protein